VRQPNRRNTPIAPVAFLIVRNEIVTYLGYAMWRRYLRLAHGYTAAQEDAEGGQDSEAA
jgi:hypothetical protein